MSVKVDCLERGPGCQGWATPGKARCSVCERARQRERNAKPSRRALYGGSWAAESKAIRRSSPYCVVCLTSRDLTVDHPTRDVLCRSHHGEREAARRRAKAT